MTEPLRPRTTDSPVLHGYLVLAGWRGAPYLHSELAHVTTEQEPTLVVLERLVEELGQRTDLALVFQRCASLLAEVDHPAVRGVRRVHPQPSGGAVVAREFHDGRPLFDVIRACHARQAELPYALLAYVLACVAEGQRAVVDAVAARRAEVPLSGCTPDTIALGFDGTVQVCAMPPLDFLAQWRASPGNAPLDTLAYQPPEVVRHERADERAQVFSLGAVLHECATRALPFPGADATAMAEAIVHGAVTPLTRLNPSAPRLLERTCLAALEKDPRNRPTLAELSDALRQLARTDRVGVSAGHLGTLMDLLFPADQDAERQALADLRHRLSNVLFQRQQNAEVTRRVRPQEPPHQVPRPVEMPTLPDGLLPATTASTPVPNHLKETQLLRPAEILQADFSALPTLKVADPPLLGDPGERTQPAHALADEPLFDDGAARTVRTPSPFDAVNTAEVTGLLESARRASEQSGFFRPVPSGPEASWGRLARPAPPPEQTTRITHRAELSGATTPPRPPKG